MKHIVKQQEPGPGGKLGEFRTTINSLFGGYATP